MNNVHVHPSDEILMAYADGELEEGAAVAVERALAADTDLARRLVDFIRSRRVARNQFASEDGGVSDDLRTRLASLINERGNTAPRRSQKINLYPQVWGGYAAAAVIGGAMVLTVATAYLSEGRPSDEAGTRFGRVEGPLISAALTSAASGTTQSIPGGNMRPIGTYRLPGGTICRDFVVTFDQESVEGVACQQGRVWRTMAAVSSGVVGEYVPSTGENLVDGYLSAVRAGEPISPDEEAKVLNR